MMSSQIKISQLEYPPFKTTEYKSKKSKYALVIPVINEGKNIQNVIKKLKKYSRIVDIIIADGGSIDGSLNNKYLKQQGVNTLLIKTGEGKIGAQYRMAYYFIIKRGYEGVIHMDGNGKDDAGSLKSFIKYLDNGYDYVQGSRFLPGAKAVNTPILRYLGIRFILSPILSIGAGHWFTDTSNGHRAYSRKLLLDPSLFVCRNIFSSYEILFYVTARAKKLKLKVTEIPVSRRYPKDKIPTKIIGLSKNFEIIKTSLKAVLGFYDPKY